MVQAPAKSTTTLRAFLALPETDPASEYINGQIIKKPMPQGKRSTIQRDLTIAIESVLKPEKIGRAFPELRCSFGDRSIVPDVSVFSRARIPRNADGSIANQFEIAPDWVIEILSPSQSQTRVTKNILYCLKHGTQLGWLIDPEEQTIFIHGSEKVFDVFDMRLPQAQLPVPPFAQKVTLTIREVMDWLFA